MFTLYHSLLILLRIPWTTRRANQSILKEINPEFSLKGLLDSITNSIYINLTNLQEIMKDREACTLQPMGSQRAGHYLGTKQK